MILAIAAQALESATAVQYHELHGYIPLPWENHRLFGAGFLLVAVVLLVEALAGGIWFRQSWRRDIWPAVLMLLGWGLIMVAFIDPNDRIIHLLIGSMMVVAGVAERRYRHGHITLGRANLFLIPALAAGALEIGVFHSHGAITDSEFLVHALLGITAGFIGIARVYQAMEPQSMWRSALIAFLVLMLSVELLGLSHGENIDDHGTGSFSGVSALSD
jgi:hypothetical protein